jgi:hypothetical protein
VLCESFRFVFDLRLGLNLHDTYMIFSLGLKGLSADGLYRVFLIIKGCQKNEFFTLLIQKLNSNFFTKEKKQSRAHPDICLNN